MKMNEKYNGEPITLTFADEERGVYTVVVEEGTGDNLWNEDVENGYVDYINWTMYTMKLDYNLPVFVEWDGGMILTKTYVQEMTAQEICNLVLDNICSGDAPFIAYASEELSM